MDTISVRDAQILEDDEQYRFLSNRTRRAIGDTYTSKFVSRGRGVEGDEDFRESKTSHKPFTKSRRKLPGKRKWKNKDEQYKKLYGQMAVESFNRRQAANAAAKRIFKRQQKLMQPVED